MERVAFRIKSKAMFPNDLSGELPLIRFRWFIIASVCFLTFWVQFLDRQSREGKLEPARHLDCRCRAVSKPRLAGAKSGRSRKISVNSEMASSIRFCAR